MKKLILLGITLTLSFGFLIAQTIIPDSSFVSGTWYKSNSPYIIMGEAIVPSGSTLTIEPGVIVKFKTGTKYQYPSNIDVGFFNVYGKIAAIGTAEDSILFTRDGNAGNWGILFLQEGSDSSQFKYSVFEYSNKVDNICNNASYKNYSGAISLFLSKASIQKCYFRYCNDYAIFSRGSLTSIVYNYFTTNAKSLSSNYYGKGKDVIQNNEITNNSSCAVYIGNPISVFANNSIHNNTEKGIWIDDASPEITSNIIFNNLYGIYSGEDVSSKIFNNSIFNNTYGIYCDESYMPLIVGNVINKNKYGIICSDYSHARILNNTIINNSVDGFENWSGSKPILRNNIFWGNGKTFDFEQEFTLSNSILPDSAPPKGIADQGENIYGIYPNFQDTTNNVFSLKSGSIGINKGYYTMEDYQIPLLDFGGSDRIVGGRIDIGAYESQHSIDYIRIQNPYYHKYMVSNMVDTLYWSASNKSGSVTIKYSTDNGNSWNILSASAANNGKYAWKVPELISDNCKWLIKSNSNPLLSDTSHYCFTISPNRIPDGTLLYGTLKNDYSPYTFMGRTEVPIDSLLIIEPGCRLNMAATTPKGEIRVYGKLAALGEKDSLIIFTRESEPGNWMNITIYANKKDTSILSYCKVEYASSNTIGHQIFYGAIAVIGANLKVDHSIILNSSSSGIDVERGYISGSPASFCEVTNSLIYKNNQNGVDNYVSANVINIINSTIAFNKSEGLSGIDIARNCIIYGNNGSFSTSYYPSVSYSLMGDLTLPANVTNLGGNIFGLFPQFIDTANFDFHLRENSPCINTGNPDDDYFLEPNPNGNRIDMGAYGNTSEATSFIPNPRIDKLSRQESSIFGHDTLIITGLYFGSVRGTGKVKLNNVETLEYIKWENNTIICIVPPNQALQADIIITNNSGNASTYNDVYEYIAPVLKSVDPIYTSLSGNTTVTLKGSFFGEAFIGIKLFFNSSEALEYLSWNDTLIRVKCPAEEEGMADLILLYNDSIKHSFESSFLYTDKQVNAVCGSVSGIWDKNSIYYITCPITVAYGKTLSIKEGATIILNGEESGILPSITNNGKLEVTGTAVNPVIFNPIPGVIGSWGGIILNGTSDIHYAEIKNAVNGLTYENGTNHIVHDSKISLSKENGILLKGIDSYPSLILTGSTITKNKGWGILIRAHAGSDYSGSASGTYRNNIISENSLGGVQCRATGSTPTSIGWYPVSESSNVYPHLINNTIINNIGPGIDVFSDGDYDSPFTRIAQCNPKIYQNIIADNQKEGIIIDQSSIMSYSEPDIQNCVIWNNETGITQNNGNTKLRNTIIWGENEQRVDAITGILDVNYSDLMNALPGVGNIISNPLFTDPSQLNFNLSAGSPCIDGGSNDLTALKTDFEGKMRVWDGNYNLDTIIDIGILEYGSPCNIVNETRYICQGSVIQIGDSIFSEAGDYSVILLNQYGCDSIVNLKLVVNPIHQTHLTDTICQGEIIQIGDSIFRFEGNYAVILSNRFGCDSVITLDLTINSVDITVTELENTLTANASGSIYRWLDCHNSYFPLSGETNQSYTPKASGNYAVEVIQGNCTDTSDCHTITIVTSIENNDFGNSLLIYPNPTEGHISIELGELFQDVMLKVTNHTGQVIATQKYGTIEKLDFTLTGAKGLYLLEIYTIEGKRAVIKVIKE